MCLVFEVGIIKQNILFVCSRNQWRSPTAETVWRNHPELNVRSGGTSPRAKRRVTIADIQWADKIMVMETKHRARLQAAFTRPIEYKEVYVLDIPDDYKYMDPELVEELQDVVAAILEIDY